MVKLGGSLGQGPATEITHLGLNQPPVFPSVCIVVQITHINMKINVAMKVYVNMAET